ncbi:hypothetical protein Asd1617_06051 [Shigella dysenteriae 1617]|uniref:Uncharacterized protein n=1 Tax=Shigella dysenteriae 1617 TaxID=754093 RepID=A0A0A7A3H1_SHIDY|nr:hypothetical protein Asd1617_06051 [Shigella dysenteriae 1617]
MMLPISSPIWRFNARLTGLISVSELKNQLIRGITK